MFIADLHIHSKYSRATSRDCVPELLELWARRKGLDLIGTGDFTHPAWREELHEKLTPAEEGLYMLKKPFRQEGTAPGGDAAPRFILSAEISSIYKKNGKVRKVHNLILLPSLEAASTLSRRLEAIGNLHSDGRPILGLDSRDLLEVTLDACPTAIFIPAHIWTPHFSLFGAYSGFDEITECFEDLTGHIDALETGLSSDPPMNWRLSALDRFTLVSNSDAHSPANLAREANLFDTALSYPHIAQALKNRHTGEFYGTLEFFPEEGKYHCDGHRTCKVCMQPSETKAVSGICPTCGGRITVGVLHRAEALADRSEGFTPPAAKHFERLIPLQEVIAASLGMTAASQKVKEQYNHLLHTLGPELFILREASSADIRREAGVLIAEGIARLRCGKVEIQPGYDGEYGKIKLFDPAEISLLSGQISFFPGGHGRTPAKEMRTQEDGAQQAAPRSADTNLQGGQTEAGQQAGLPYGLNREQWEAVSAGQPAVAVIAGPGTGKTKTLISRIAYLIETCGVPPCEIAAVTFTNKAAGEIRARLAAHFGDRHALSGMTVGTFHAICLQMLAKQKGKSNMPIIDEADALSIVRDVLNTLGLKNPPRDIQKAISLIKNGMLAAEESNLPPGVLALYQARLAQYGVLDYDDILLDTLALFERGLGEDAATDKRLLPAFSHILVDEFQDINALQYRLIQAWRADSAGLFVIGDPNQSIYGFRGSDPRCFERLLSDHPKLHQVTLTQNYRSTPEIIRCAQSIMSGQAANLPALEANRASGPKVRLLNVEDAFSEALFVAKEINRMVGGLDMLDAQGSAPVKGKSPVGHAMGFSDIAILYRTNRQADMLEECLHKEGIPYVVAGRDDFLMEAEVREAIAFFRFLLNPEDLVSLRNCLSNANIGRMAQTIMEAYAATEKSLSALRGILNNIPCDTGGRLQTLMDRFQKYQPLIHSKKPETLIGLWMEDGELPPSGCMQMLFHTSVMYETMPSLLDALLLGHESDLVRSGGKKYMPDAVSLLTLHGAKGLEFPAVFLCGVTEELIPFKKRRSICDIDEERRLFYVGMTRAKDALILLTTAAPSPFLIGLPPEATEHTCAHKQNTPRQVSFLHDC